MESRANAARAVGILRGRAATEDLIEALHSKDDNVLYESLIALQKVRDPAVAPRIIFLFNDLQEKVQVAALETAGVLRSKEALPDLRKTFDRARNDKVRRAALTAIAMIPDEQSRALYQRNLTDKDENLRAAAAEGLGRLAKDSDRAGFEKSFNDDKKMKPRLAYAFAAVYAGATETSTFSPLQYLVNTLNSKLYRGIAEAYLIELARQPQVRENVYAQIKQATRDEKMGLARVLAASGDKNSVAPLELLTKDPDTEVAQECLRSLRILKARL
jgi:HEAT repeat protein